MGTTSLKMFLQSLCCNSFWNYAVFWKLQCQSQLLLTWEDGYCDFLNHGNSSQTISENICYEGLNEPPRSNAELATYDGMAVGNMAELSLAYLSSIQYGLGDGVVGDVAYTGNYRWFFSNNIASGELITKSSPECPDEWLLQFAAGIKTILLVPIFPHGVLQLGSLETVVEDSMMVAYIKDKFLAHHCVVGCSETSPSEGNFPDQSLLMSALMENLDEFLSVTTNEMTFDDLMDFSDVKPPSYSPLNVNHIKTSCGAQDLTYTAGLDMPNDCSSVIEDHVNTEFGIVDAPEPVLQYLDFNNSTILETGFSRCPDEDITAFPYPKNSNVTICEVLMEQPVENDDRLDTSNREVSPSLCFPRASELHKALGPSFMQKTNDYAVDLSVSGDDVYSSSSVISGMGLSGNESNTDLAEKHDAKLLLESVAENVPNKDPSGEANRINSSGKCAASADVLGRIGNIGMGGECTLTRNLVSSTISRRGRNLIRSSSSSATSYESMISELTDDEPKARSNFMHQRKSSLASGGSKRRGKPCDKKKARPRDRQLIQDRLKELRELVPNGKKYSIDGLLDRTIAHMLFLKSVGDRADKLKKWVHFEGAERKYVKPTKGKDGNQNGTSWAFELGNEQQMCPIIVEDLEYPGHMIIEMICNEEGWFLEIAEVIYGLELTILKGVTERRLGNTWAHFVIEAPRGLHRLDIFWPLMKLLQQQCNPITSEV